MQRGGSGRNTPKVGDSEGSDSDVSQSPGWPKVKIPIPFQEGSGDYESWVKDTLGQLATNSGIMLKQMLSDKEAKKAGVVERLTTVEEEIYGSKGKNKKGLTQRVEDLETKAKMQSGSDSLIVDGTVSNVDLEQEVELLCLSNAFLVGAASKLQHDNKTLQNQLYIQQDRSNFLNLHLGGVEELPDVSCKAEAVAFFKNILQIKEVTEKDFIKAHCKSKANEYTEEVQDGDRTLKLKVKAAGIMFVHMASEYLRELAIQKAQGLGGRRHTTLNHILCQNLNAKQYGHLRSVTNLVF